MRLGQVFITAVAVAGLAHYAWRSHERTVIARQMLVLADTNGFVPVQMPDGSAHDTVLILAAINCPREGARRADAMASRLGELGIPNVRTNHYGVSSVTPDNYDAVKRAFDIMNQNEIPVVMINGKAKANPTADEVVSEYRDGHGAESATLASRTQN